MRAIFLVFFVCSVFAESPEEFGRRISAHLLLHDSYSAVQEAKRALILFPESEQLQVSFIRALCAKGDEVDALEAWKRAVRVHGIKSDERHLLEMLAWGVLNKGENSAQPVVRLSSLFGACSTNDAKALPLLLKEMRGSNSWLRAVAVRLAASFGDTPLQDELLRLLHEERIWYVRLEVLHAIGQLRMKSAHSKLKEIIAHSKTLPEERGQAILALAHMVEEISEEDLQKLISSPRAGFRQLASELVAHLDLKQHTSCITELLKDTSYEVRLSVLNCLGLLRPSEGAVLAQCLPLLEDPTPQVAITAAWTVFVLGDERGGQHLKKWILTGDLMQKRLASSALAAAGVRGKEITAEMLKNTTDFYTQVNLAMGLIGLRHETKLACDTIFSVLSKERKELWMWDNQMNPLFRTLAPSRISHVDHIPHFPVVVDQLVKLDLLSVLSIMRYPKALDAVKALLKNQTWGVSGAAIATLLEEGNEECLSLVEKLLTDPDQKIRMQAAFILALLGGESSAVKVLQEVFPHMDRETKIHILEALGHIGDRESIPFLLEIFKEPFQVQRLVAASSLIQCLYH